MPNPLDGVRILELGQIIAGTYGCQVLSDLGAEVIKIEAPEGDLGRIPSVAPYKGVSGLFLTYNRNKQSVVINLKSEAGRKAGSGYGAGRNSRRSHAPSARMPAASSRKAVW